jgi:hypothetical protein
MNIRFEGGQGLQAGDVDAGLLERLAQGGPDGSVVSGITGAAGKAACPA